MGTYVGSNTGIVLWITPNEAIYSQTKKALTDRESPLRQILDRAGAGRVKILEKDDPVHALDVGSHLCVMLLMLQSANRGANIRCFLPLGFDADIRSARDSVSAASELFRKSSCGLYTSQQ